jgi:N-acetylneuraminate synthase/N,N'-diacetyllegionaminate synthase
MNKIININNYKIGTNQPVFIIAEVGVNHNGDLELAKKLIKEAARCGADCVKFQTFKAEKLVLQDAPKANYQLQTTSNDESQLEMLKKLEMNIDKYSEIIRCCENEGVLFISTPYNIEDVDFLEDLGVPAYKLASMHAAEPWFARYVAKKNKPIFLSTGMSTLSEIDTTVRSIKETGNDKLILLQCTTNYPSKIEDTNLLAMNTMSETFNLIVGYSDHTEDDTACIASVALGAKVIEKHFTLDKSLPGPDHTTSATPIEFMNLVKNIRNTEKSLGSSVKQPCDIEKINMKGMRRSIVVKNDIDKGVKIKDNMIALKRPSSGISPMYLDEIIGKKTTNKVFKDQILKWSDIGE